MSVDLTVISKFSSLDEDSNSSFNALEEWKNRKAECDNYLIGGTPNGTGYYSVVDRQHAEKTYGDNFKYCVYINTSIPDHNYKNKYYRGMFVKPSYGWNNINKKLKARGFKIVHAAITRSGCFLTVHRSKDQKMSVRMYLNGDMVFSLNGGNVDSDGKLESILNFMEIVL